MTEPAIRVENLGKHYQIAHQAARGQYRTLRESLVGAAKAPMRWARGERTSVKESFWALEDLSFDVHPGEVVGIIGRNGAGKSTLLKILSRITKPTRGRVVLNGRVGSLLEVGTGFHPELSGRENVYLNGSILGMKRREIDRKFDEIVAFSEVEMFLDTPVKRYSSGMYVRLAFAVAAHLEPEILLVDEVLAVGDAIFQKKCLARIRSIAKAGGTVFFVSHTMAAVLVLCDRAIHLERGQLIDDARAAAVVGAYLSTMGSAVVDGNADLREHPSRDKDSLTVLVGISFLNREGSEVGALPCGEPLRVLLECDAPNGGLNNPDFGIGFNDAHGNRIFSVATYLSVTTIPSIHGRVKVACDISELPLPPGSYTLSLSVGISGRSLLDNIESAVTIEVLPNDFYGNGNTPSPGFGHTLLRSNWALI